MRQRQVALKTWNLIMFPPKISGNTPVFGPPRVLFAAAESCGTICCPSYGSSESAFGLSSSHAAMRHHRSG